MKQTLTLSPIDKGNHTIPFRGEYEDKALRLNVYLLANFSVVSNRELTKDEKVFTFQFGGKIKSWDYHYDDRKPNEVLWAEKLKRHELVKCDGNTNLFRPIFEVIDTRKEASKKVLTNKNMLIVGNMVGAMKVSEMRDIAYYKGVDVSRMTGEQIYLKLCSLVPGTELGILMENPSASITSFSNPDREVVTMVQKAIALEVIKKSNAMYYIGQTLAGENAISVVAFCKSNTQLYENFVKREVELNDRLPLDIIEDITVSELLDGQREKEYKHKVASKTPEQNDLSLKEHQKKQHDQEMERQALLQPLKDECKRLGIKGYNVPTWTEETFKRKIAERKAELEKETAIV